MRAKTLMRTQFTEIPEDLPLDRARVMLRREQIDTLPVVRGDTLVGLLRLRDVERLGPSTLPSLAAHDWAWGRAPLTVKAAMTPSPVTLEPDSSVHDAVRVLLEGHLEAAPVIEGSALVGLVTARDLLAILIGLLESFPPAGFDHVLVAVDLGGGTAAAVATGLRLARQHGARLTLLHVLAPTPPRLLAEGVPGEMLDALRRRHRDECLDRLAALAPTDTGLDIGRLVLSGDTCATIAAAASRLAADVIVLGSARGRRFLERSLAEALVERVPCPVLVIRPDILEATHAHLAHASA